MKISVITPSYNQQKFIEECILSVINQPYSNIEYLIIDGGSNDGSVGIIKKYAQSITYWVSEKDQGQTHAINKGIMKATGDIISYLCSDDLYESDIFNFVVRIFKDNPQIDMIYGNCNFIDYRGNILRHKKSIKYNYDKLMIKNIIWQPTVFLRRRVIEKIGLFDENLNFAMDYEYWLRVAREFTIVNVDKDIARYRWHENSKTISSEKRHLKEAYSLLKKNGGGGCYSWFMHNIYWPKTSKIKHFLFRIFKISSIFK